MADSVDAWTDRVAELSSALRDWLGSIPSEQPQVWVPLLGAGLVLGLLWSTARLRKRRPTLPQDLEGRIQTLIERNDYEAAAQLRFDQGQFAKALALYQNSQNLSKVALCYVSLKQPQQAAEVYLRTGRLAEAAHYFQIAGIWKEAAKCLESLGSLREAAELYERAGEAGKAAHLLRALGDATNAARLFDRAGLHAEAAAALLVAHGREASVLKRAGSLFENAGEPRRAAECFAGAGEWIRAAELFEEIRECSLAAQAYEHAEAWARAGAAFEQAGALREARANYERAGDTLRASQLAERLGNLLDAGRGYYTLGAYDHAIETLQSVAEASPQRRAATVLLGRIFLEKGLYERAIEKLRPLAGDPPHGKDDLEVLSLLSEAHERAGEFGSALRLLEQVLDIDDAFEDADERLERLQEKAWGGSSTPADYYGERYDLQREIGRGGMGIVHLAQDRELDRPVAIKFLPRELAANAGAVKLFRQEARSAASMNHPNIVHIYDVAVIGARPCIVMEYVEGQTVRELMRVPNSKTRKPLTPEYVARIASDICNALQYAHAHSVIHRDVKPGNILITPAGSAKLMDFGISKVLESEPPPHGDTQARGTPQYMPPEQIMGSEVDGRTDLYALGISMFEMLTGLRPFRGEDIVEQQLKSVIPDPRDLNAQVPEVLVSIVRRACQKEASQRYPSASAMAEALESFLESE